MDPKLTDYFNGNLSPEEELRFQQYLAQNADSKALSEDLEKLFDSCGNAGADRGRLSALLSSIRLRLSIRPAHSRRRKFFAVAGAVASAACIAFVCFNIGLGLGRGEAPCVEWKEVSVPVAGSRELLLSDGTRLVLSPLTRVTYPERFTNGDRRIFVDGEFFAEVARDSEHPFIISSSGVNVKVLGTTFNFKSFSANDNVELALLEGSVQMQFDSDRGSRQVLVHPGQAVHYDRQSDCVATEEFDVDTYRPLYENHSAMYFRNMSLQDIAFDLSRRFGRRIVITDASMAQARFFAIFTNNESLDQILKSICMNRGVHVSDKDGVIYLTTNK